MRRHRRVRQRDLDAHQDVGHCSLCMHGSWEYVNGDANEDSNDNNKHVRG